MGDGTALVVIDPQADFMPMVEGGPDTALAAMGRLLEAARAGGRPVVVTQEVHRPGRVDFGRELDGDEPVHCVEGTAGAELVGVFDPLPGESLVRKRRYSAFFATDLDLLLRGLGVDTIVVCGFLADVCVHYTCADAHQLDYRLRLVPEACGGSTRAAAEAVFSAIERLQRGATVALESACQGLRHRSAPVLGQSRPLSGGRGYNPSSDQRAPGLARA